LLVRNQLMGILNIYSKGSIRRFTTLEQELARVFATQAAIAVQNAELYSGAQSRAKQLQDVLAGGKNITALRPIREVLQAITDGLQANFGYDAVTLFPYQAGTKIFAAPVISGHLYYPEIVLRKATGDALVENRLTGPRRHFSAHSNRDELLAGAFTERESIRASGYVRLYFGDEIVGILFVNYRKPHVFTADEQQAVQLFADQAAIAIRNAEQYDRLCKKEQQLLALHESGAAIAQAGIEAEAVLQTILEQAVTVTGAHFGTIQRLKNDALEFVAAWPQERAKWLKHKFGNLPLDGPGITVRAVVLNDAQLVSDVQKDPEFIDATNETGSELAVVLRQGGQAGGQPIGVLNVEHREVGKLNMEDRSLLIQLANLAAITLQNAERAEQLSRTNAVALMGAWGADIAHTVNREVAAIRLAIFELEPQEDLPVAVKERLQQIEVYTAQLAMPELPEQFPDFGEKLEVRHAPSLDNVIRSEIGNLQKNHPTIEFRLNPNCPQTQVAMHEQWLRRLLRHFIQNSINAALETGQEVTITIDTALEPSEQDGVATMAAISIEDNGKGIRPEIESLLFRRPIAHTGNRADERHGRGLLLVRYVIELHGGRVQLDWSKPGEGARFTFSIPLA
jgi:GAF domain-containing protein